MKYLHSSANVCAAVLRCIRPKKSLETCNITYLVSVCIEIDIIIRIHIHIQTTTTTNDSDDDDDVMMMIATTIATFYIITYYVF